MDDGYQDLRFAKLAKVLGQLGEMGYAVVCTKAIDGKYVAELSFRENEMQIREDGEMARPATMLRFEGVTWWHLHDKIAAHFGIEC